MIRFSTVFLEPDESDSANPIIVIKHPTSSVCLKVHLFHSSAILLTSQMKRTYMTFLTKSNLSVPSGPLYWRQLLYRRWPKDAELWAPGCPGSMGPMSFSWCWAGVSCDVPPFPCAAAHILTCSIWKDSVKHHPRLVLLPLLLWNLVHQILTPSQALSVCPVSSSVSSLSLPYQHGQYLLSSILFLAALALHGCEGFFLVAASRGCSLVVVCRLLIAVASLVAEHRLQSVRASIVAAFGLGSCSSWAVEHRLNSCGTQA